jgi:hypothetical protein
VGPASVRVPGFTPSAGGFHFANAFPKEPDFTVDLPGLGVLPVGDASNGVCGGMVFAVRDIFETTGQSFPADTTPPADGTALFRYIVERLIVSFDLPSLGVLKYYEWMVTADGDTRGAAAHRATRRSLEDDRRGVAEPATKPDRRGDASAAWD